MNAMYKAPETGRAALIDALVRGALRGVPGDELQRAALHNRLTSWALRVLGSHLSGGGSGCADAGSVVQGMKQLLRQQQRDTDATRCAEGGGRGGGRAQHGGGTHATGGVSPVH